MNNKHVLTAFALLMLSYQAWRVLDYMSGSLQGVTPTTALIVSIAFLTFSEIGLLIWLHSGRPGASTDTQETIATIMIWVDFFGSMILGLADLLKHNTIYVVDLSAIDPLLFLTPWLLVVANVGAYLAYYMSDAEDERDRTERKLRHKERQLELKSMRDAVEELDRNSQNLTKELTPYYYKDVVNRVTGRTLQRFKAKAKRIDDNDDILVDDRTGQSYQSISGETLQVNPTRRNGRKEVNRKR